MKEIVFKTNDTDNSLKILNEVLNNFIQIKRDVETCKFGFITATDLADF